MQFTVWAGKGIVLAALLIGAACRDIRCRKVPDRFSLGIILTALIMPDTGRWWGVMCALPFFFAAMTIGGIGGADIKIMGAAGMVLGFHEGIAAMVIGLAGMLLFHMGERLLRKGRAAQSYPLVPFLTVGVLLVYLTLAPIQ